MPSPQTPSPATLRSVMAAPEDRQTPQHNDRQVKLVPGGIDIAGQTLPLLAGSAHYWRLDPNEWRACLVAVKKLGLHFVDTYVPWGVHEVSPGKLELGETDPQRDIAKPFVASPKKSASGSSFAPARTSTPNSPTSVCPSASCGTVHVRLVHPNKTRSCCPCCRSRSPSPVMRAMRITTKSLGTFSFSDQR